MNNSEKMHIEDMPAIMAEMKKDLEELKSMLNQPHEPKEEEYFTRQQVKEKWKIGSDNTIIRLERENILNPVRIGRKLLYRKSEIEKIGGNIE